MWIAISVWEKKYLKSSEFNAVFFSYQMNTLGIPKKLSKECVPRCLISTGYTLSGGEIFIFPIIQRTIKNRVLKTSSHDRKDSSDNWTFLYMLSNNYVLLSSGVIIEVRVYWNSLNRQFNWRTNILNNQIFQSI